MTGRLVGIGLVVLLHIGLVYALITGLARDLVKEVTKDIVVETVEEPPPPPEELPPPPPPPTDVPPPPPAALPPPVIKIENPPPQQNPPTQVVQQAVQRQEAFAPPAPPGPPAPPAPPQGGSINVKSLQTNRPDYPSQSIRLEEEGTTRMRLYCSAEGRITEGTVEKSSGYERLDNAWLAMAKRGRWKCDPLVQDGKPTGAWLPVVVPLTFRLEDAR